MGPERDAALRLRAHRLVGSGALARARPALPRRGAREGIVTFPNSGYWRHRLDIYRGHMPVSKTLPHAWWNTPNIHLCTVKDFEDLCVKVEAQILDERVLHDGRQVTMLPNLRGSLGVFRFRRR